MLDTRLLESRLAAFASRPLDSFEKGLPAQPGLTLESIGSQGWRLGDGHVPFPVLALRWNAMLENIQRMQAFCDGQGALLAPHGKTTMAPQIFLEQLRAGAWGITVATIRQAQVCAAFGVGRVVIANQLTTSGEFRALVDLLETENGPEIVVFVDNEDVIQALAQELRSRPTATPLAILVEVGFNRGRNGIRIIEDLDPLVAACNRAAPELQLIGVAGFEGILRPGDVDPYLHLLKDAATRLRSLHQHARVVSAGGSMFFDRVIENLGRDALPDFQLVLRSGTYVAHDHGLYHRGSPFGPDRPLGGEPLLPALEIWSSVVSRPEPELAILGFGRRDASDDSGLPVALGRWDGSQVRLDSAEIIRLNDQHAYLRIPASAQLQPGDVVICGISHPCTTFDRWRFALAVDDAGLVTGAVRTFF